MAELLGLVASVIQVAGAGLKISKELYQYADGVATADRRIKDIATEIELTSSVIGQLGHVFGQDETSAVISKDAVKTADKAMKECSAVFAEIDATLKKSSRNRFGRLMLPFRDDKIVVLQRHIETLKLTLQLLMSVLILAQQVASSKLDREAEARLRDEIAQLLKQKEKSFARYDESLKSFSLSEGSTVLDDDVESEQGKENHFSMSGLAMTASAMGSSITSKTLSRCVKHIQNLLGSIETLQQALAKQVDGDDHSQHHQSLLESYFHARGHLDSVILGSSEGLRDASDDPGITMAQHENADVVDAGAQRALTGSTVGATSEPSLTSMEAEFEKRLQHAIEQARAEEREKAREEMAKLQASSQVDQAIATEATRINAELQRLAHAEKLDEAETKVSMARVHRREQERKKDAEKYPQRGPRSVRLFDKPHSHFAIPFDDCQTWTELHNQIMNRYNDKDRKQDIADGHFDLFDIDDNIIRPSEWDTVVEPALCVRLKFRPVPEDDNPAVLCEMPSRRTRRPSSVAQSGQAVLEEEMHMPSSPVVGMIGNKSDSARVHDGTAYEQGPLSPYLKSLPSPTPEEDSPAGNATHSSRKPLTIAIRGSPHLSSTPLTSTIETQPVPESIVPFNTTGDYCATIGPGGNGSDRPSEIYVSDKEEKNHFTDSYEYDIQEDRRRALEHLQRYGVVQPSKDDDDTFPNLPDYSGDGYGDEWVGMRHHHPTALDDVPEDKEEIKAISHGVGELSQLFQREKLALVDTSNTVEEGEPTSQSSTLPSSGAADSNISRGPQDQDIESRYQRLQSELALRERKELSREKLRYAGRPTGCKHHRQRSYSVASTADCDTPDLQSQGDAPDNEQRESSSRPLPENTEMKLSPAASQTDAHNNPADLNPFKHASGPNLNVVEQVAQQDQSLDDLLGGSTKEMQHLYKKKLRSRKGLGVAREQPLSPGSPNKLSPPYREIEYDSIPAADNVRPGLELKGDPLNKGNRDAQSQLYSSPEPSTVDTGTERPNPSNSKPTMDRVSSSIISRYYVGLFEEEEDVTVNTSPLDSRTAADIDPTIPDPSQDVVGSSLLSGFNSYIAGYEADVTHRDGPFLPLLPTPTFMDVLMDSARHPPEVDNEEDDREQTDTPSTLQQEIDDTVVNMRENINKVSQRGEKLDTLQEKTDNLAVTAQGFRRGAHRVQPRSGGDKSLWEYVWSGGWWSTGESKVEDASEESGQAAGGNEVQGKEEEVNTEEYDVQGQDLGVSLPTTPSQHDDEVDKLLRQWTTVLN